MQRKWVFKEGWCVWGDQPIIIHSGNVHCNETCQPVQQCGWFMLQQHLFELQGWMKSTTVWEQNESKEKTIYYNFWNKKKNPFFTSLMSTNQLNSLVTFSLSAWLNITIFYNSTEAQCLWLKEGIAILKFVVKFGISTKIVLNKSHPTISVQWLHSVSQCSLIQLRLKLGGADIRGFPHWIARTFARWLLRWVDMHSSLLSITEDKWPQGTGHVDSAFLIRIFISAHQLCSDTPYWWYRVTA